MIGGFHYHSLMRNNPSIKVKPIVPIECTDELKALIKLHECYFVADISASDCKKLYQHAEGNPEVDYTMLTKTCGILVLRYMRRQKRLEYLKQFDEKINQLFLDQKTNQKTKNLIRSITALEEWKEEEEISLDEIEKNIEKAHLQASKTGKPTSTFVFDLLMQRYLLSANRNTSYKSKYKSIIINLIINDENLALIKVLVQQCRDYVRLDNQNMAIHIIKILYAVIAKSDALNSFCILKLIKQKITRIVPSHQANVIAGLSSLPSELALLKKDINEHKNNELVHEPKRKAKASPARLSMFDKHNDTEFLNASFEKSSVDTSIELGTFSTPSH